MSMHKIPLSEMERKGLEYHGLAVGKPSQLSDAFRQGISWGLSQANKLKPESLAEISILRNCVSEANSGYMNAPLGDSYREYQQLKGARREYSEKCVAFAEEIMENVCKESKEY